MSRGTIEITQGEWKVVHNTKLPDGTATETILNASVFPQFVAHCEGPNRHANSLLISAAPDYYAVVAAFLEFGRAGGDTSWHSKEAQGFFYRMMRADGKAKGESQF